MNTPNFVHHQRVWWCSSSYSAFGCKQVCLSASLTTLRSITSVSHPYFCLQLLFFINGYWVICSSLLTLSHRHDVPNVTFLPSTRADMTLRMSSPQRQVEKTGVRGFYIIMWAGLKGLCLVILWFIIYSSLTSNYW